jgi:hypothetical protein
MMECFVWLDKTQNLGHGLTLHHFESVVQTKIYSLLCSTGALSKIISTLPQAHKNLHQLLYKHFTLQQSRCLSLDPNVSRNLFLNLLPLASPGSFTGSPPPRQPTQSPRRERRVSSIATPVSLPPSAPLAAIRHIPQPLATASSIAGTPPQTPSVLLAATGPTDTITWATES